MKMRIERHTYAWKEKFCQEEINRLGTTLCLVGAAIFSFGLLHFYLGSKEPTVVKTKSRTAISYIKE